ncbi:hypothetical protein NDU88_004278 [Pleurodeles waltl]|uniref:Uncharacterized protein n=1 Tax=Pleurodeles waltl TaxID=8319 RepID=A0AAV7SIH8_PLEWA|nr:hypothetical protein NDU88_004278 [Pleurodeles waltl]
MAAGNVNEEVQVMCVLDEGQMLYVGQMCDRLDYMVHGVPLSVIPLQVSTHQKEGLWCAIDKDVRTLGVHSRQSTNCRKRWEDLRRWAQKTAEGQLGMASQQGRGARRSLTPLIACILAVAYPELDGRLRAAEQQGEYSVCDIHHFLPGMGFGCMVLASECPNMAV